MARNLKRKRTRVSYRELSTDESFDESLDDERARTRPPRRKSSRIRGASLQSSQDETELSSILRSGLGISRRSSTNQELDTNESIRGERPKVVAKRKSSRIANAGKSKTGNKIRKGSSASQSARVRRGSQNGSGYGGNPSDKRKLGQHTYGRRLRQV